MHTLCSPPLLSHSFMLPFILEYWSPSLLHNEWSQCSKAKEESGTASIERWIDRQCKRAIMCIGLLPMLQVRRTDISNIISAFEHSGHEAHPGQNTSSRTHICAQQERDNHSVNNCQCQLEEEVERLYKCDVPVILSDGGQSVFCCAWVCTAR